MSEPDPDTLVSAAWRLIEVGNPRGALVQLKSVLAQDPVRVNALVAISQCQLNLGDLVEAQAMITALLREAPNLPAAHRLQAEVLRRRNQAWSALPVARQAVALDPREPLGYHILGMVQMACHDYKAALATCDEGLKVAPNSAVLTAQKARCVLELRGGKSAEPMAEEALKVAPDSAFVLRIAARVALARNKLAHARDLLASVLRRNANDEEALTLYLLTDSSKHTFLRERMVFGYWRKEKGFCGQLAYAGVWIVVIAVLLVAVFALNVPGLFIGLGVRFFLKSQYDEHRRAVKAHFATPQLKSGF